MKVVVLLGGRSYEREISLRSGYNVSAALRKLGYEVIELDPPPDLLTALKVIEPDVVFLALHGGDGENGTIQGLLEWANIPYTGSNVRASAAAMDKIISKSIFKAMDIPTPDWYLIDSENDLKVEANRCIQKLKKFPMIIKPRSQGSSIGVEIIDDESQLLEQIEHHIKVYGDAFVEEYIDGSCVTVGILGAGKTLRALPVLQLSVKNRRFYDYIAKYTKGMTEFIIPANLPQPVYQKTQEIALAAHKALGCYGVSRVDIIVKDTIPYVTEVNTIPGMTSLSDLPAAAQSAQITFEELVEEILQLALQRARCKAASG